MIITLIDRNARIPIESLADDIKQQWIKSGAIKKDEKLDIGIVNENGRYYINIVVRPAASKIITKPNLSIV